MISARVQSEPFDPATEMAALADGGESGALVTFTGHVRGAPGASLELQHYPGMTEKKMAEIAARAFSRFDVTAGRVVHRYGEMRPGEAIVFVGITARHRGEAFRAAEFVIDWLKTSAPFWKRETGPDGTSHWVEARADDDEKAAAWD